MCTASFYCSNLAAAVASACRLNHILWYCLGDDASRMQQIKLSLAVQSLTLTCTANCSASHTLHSLPGVANRDIKLDNILLDRSVLGKADWPILKICDWGYAKHDAKSLAKSKVVSVGAGDLVVCACTCRSFRTQHRMRSRPQSCHRMQAAVLQHSGRAVAQLPLQQVQAHAGASK